MAVNIIKTYQEGRFEKTVVYDDLGNLQEIESRELVVYVNSVKNICDIIRRAGLTFSNTNVLCSGSKENQKKVRSAFGLSRGQEGGIGKVPLRDEPRKMFTLCTRTVYLGADFYSTNARTIILSDANIDCLAVDITLDLPQILGRQRLECNPWKNRAELYIRFLSEGNKITAEDFKKRQKVKIEKTKSLLSVYNKGTIGEKHNLAETYQYVAKSKNYKDDYVAVNTHDGKDLVPVFNNLVMVSEFRSFEIQQVDYPDRFRIINNLSSSGKYEFDPVMNEVDNFLNKFNSVSFFTDKMRLLCESKLSGKVLNLVLKQIPIDYLTYYNALGPNKIRALSYQKSRIQAEYNKEINNLSVNPIKIRKLFLNTFKVGARISLSDLKLTIKQLYGVLGLKRTSKAKDIEEYFEVKLIKIPQKDKRVDGYELLKIKE